MKASIILLVFALSITLTNPAYSQEQAFVESNQEFTFNLYKRLGEEPGNIIFSPYSISNALAMTYRGARGETEKQMADALCFTLPKDSLHKMYAEINRHLRKMNEKEGLSLSIANALWIEQTYSLLEEFISTMEKFYDAHLFQLDFLNEYEKSRMHINSWVEKQTHERIKDLLPQGTINPRTRLVLTNAIYFKGLWTSQFNPEATRTMPFWTTPSDSVRVPMMSQKASFNYMENQLLQMIELPYQGNGLSMLILLPKEKDGLEKLEETLTVESLSKWQKSMSEQEVQAFVPRFKCTKGFNLNDILIQMGMKDAFSHGIADFSGIEPKKELFISSVLHKAFIEVNEEGSEAAAATAVTMMLKATPPKPIPAFKADHPFLFMIQDKATGIILFFGRISEPKN
jgi:serpin B